jgi:hypothetical protein
VFLLEAKHLQESPKPTPAVVAQINHLAEQAKLAFNTTERLCRGRNGRERVRDRVHYFRARWYLELGNGDEQSLENARREAQLARRIADGRECPVDRRK